MIRPDGCVSVPPTDETNVVNHHKSSFPCIIFQLTCTECVCVISSFVYCVGDGNRSVFICLFPVHGCHGEIGRGRERAKEFSLWSNKFYVMYL